MRGHPGREWNVVSIGLVYNHIRFLQSLRYTRKLFSTDAKSSTQPQFSPPSDLVNKVTVIPVGFQNASVNDDLGSVANTDGLLLLSGDPQQKTSPSGKARRPSK